MKQSASAAAVATPTRPKSPGSSLQPKSPRTPASRTPTRPPSRPGSAPASRRMSRSNSVAPPAPISMAPVALKDQISSVFDDVRNCTFHPVVSVTAQNLQQAPFLQRVPGYISRFIELHNATPDLQKGPSANTFTFRPKINHTPKIDATLTSRGSFLSRYHDDLRHRSERKKELEALTLCTFSPSLSERSKKKSAKIRQPFLQRLADDLDKREQHVREQKRLSENVPFTFRPAVNSTDEPNFNSFLTRQVADIDEREEFFRQRQKELTKKFVPQAPPTSPRPFSAARRNASYSNGNVYSPRPQSAR